jgi:nucleoside-diphosphate-sugar epimerase
MHFVAIVGCGYTGSRLADRWLKMHHAVRGFAARATSLPRIETAGAEPQLLNLDEPIGAAIDFDDALVYYSVPPAPSGECDTRLARLLDSVRGTPRRVVYLSTTGVYGDRAGAIVDEDSRPAPQSTRAMRRLAAESALRAWAAARAISWCVLRIPGIYGPGRMPVERLRARPVPAIEFTSTIW